MKIRMGELLVKAGVIKEAQLRKALEEQRRFGGRIGDILVRLNFLSEKILVRALSKQLGIPLVAIPRDIDPEVLRRVPAHIVQAWEIVPVALLDEGRTLVVVTADPLNRIALDSASAVAGLPVKVGIAPASEVRQAIARLYVASSRRSRKSETGRKPFPAGEGNGVKDRRIDVTAATSTSKRQQFQSPSVVAAMQLGLSQLPAEANSTQQPTGSAGSITGPVATAPAMVPTAPPIPFPLPPLDGFPSGFPYPAVSKPGATRPGASNPPAANAAGAGIANPAASTPAPAPSGIGGPGMLAGLPGTLTALGNGALPPWVLPVSDGADSSLRPGPSSRVDDDRIAALEDARRRQMVALRALVELLVEKGVFSFDDYLARLKR